MLAHVTALLMAGLQVVGAENGRDPAAHQDPQTTSVPEVVVEGRRVEETVRAFVNEVAAPPPGRRLARWDDDICVGSVNLQPEYAQYLIDRVAVAAIRVGLEPGEPGCRPDVMVIASDDADSLAARLVAEHPAGFRPTRSGTDRGAQALRAFVESDAPVRWWHVSLPVSVDTDQIATTFDGDYKIGDGVTNGVGMLAGTFSTVVPVRTGSRLRSNVREDLARVVIILDVNRIGEVHYGALSDYVAMVALAQVDPEADTRGYDTVLNLFSQPSLTGFTAWDTDYLTALYSADPDHRRFNQQVRDLIRSMTIPTDPN